MKNLELQLNREIQNFGMNNPYNQILNIGMQTLNIGMQILNIGIGTPTNEFDLFNISQQIQNMINQLNNINTKINMKNEVQMNMNMKIPMPIFGMNMMNYNNMNIIQENMENNQIQLIFEISPDEKIVVNISPKKKFKDAIELFRIKANNNEKLKFLYNGKVIHSNLKIEEAGLVNLSTIIVIHLDQMIGG